MPRNVFQEPLNGVIGIAALVNVGLAAFRRAVRRHFHKLAFRHEPPANVLIDEDVAGLHEMLAGAKRRRVFVHAVRSNRVGRPLDEQRVFARRILRNVDRRKELHSVPHRDHLLLLRVVQADVALQAVVGRLSGDAAGGGKN